MKKLTMLMLGLGLTVSAMTNAAGIGVVDLARVVESSTYLKQQNAALGQSVKPTSTRLEQLGKELETADIQKMTALYQAKLNEFNTTQQGLQTKVQSTLQSMNTAFEGKVKQVAEQLRKENNLDLILNKNSTIASDAQYDLTDKMIQKVNALK